MGWVRNFITGRVQQVCVNGIYSDSANATSGIPQGSVLGPVLFVLFINDLPSNIKSNVFMFADDTKVFRTIECQNNHCILQGDLQELTEWTRKWLLTFHPDKCRVMYLGRPLPYNEYQYTMTTTGRVYQLEYTDNEKDIGVVIDSKLEFDKHISF